MGTYVIVALALLAVVGALTLIRRSTAGTAKPTPPPPEYDEAVQQLESLRSGRLWGDIGQAEPWKGPWE